MNFDTYADELQPCGYPRRALWDRREIEIARATWADCLQYHGLTENSPAPTKDQVNSCQSPEQTP